MTTFHMETDTVRALASQIRQAAEEMRSQTQNLTSFSQNIDWLGPSRDEFIMETQAVTRQLEVQAEAVVMLARRVENEVSEWEDMAAQLSGSATGNIGLILLDDATKQQIDEFIKNKSWQIILNGNNKPILTFGDGRQVDLSAVEAGDVDAIKALGSFVEYQVLTANMGKAIADGKWVQVSGYLNGNSGNWVDDYARTLPGGVSAGRTLGTMGTAIEVGDIGASFIAALADKKVGQWIEIPLGLADDKPIVYSLYVPPENHWRDVFTKTGGFVMGFPGEAAGTAVGAFTSPITGPVGPVVGNVAGGKIGGDIGEGVVGFIYDSLVPKADVPQNPHSNMIESGTMQIGNQQGVYVNSTDGADVIDLARLIKPDDGDVSTQVVYTISPEGKTHLEVITSSTF